MPQFRLIIDLGNDAMKTGNDIAKALHNVGVSINSNYTPVVRGDGNIRDINGNVVGHYEVVD